VFQYEGLTFCKLERDQLLSLLDLKKETWLQTHNTTIANCDDQTRWFESLDKDVHCPQNLILLARSLTFTVSPTTVGVFKIFNVNYIHGSADVAWDVFKEVRQKGYGKLLVAGGVKFCVDILNLRRLDAEILMHNKASMKCAYSAGFVQEGVRRGAVFKRGKYIDSITFGYLGSASR